jgi:hypothetical protein
MKVDIYTENGVLLKELGEEPGGSMGKGQRSVVSIENIEGQGVKINYDDGLWPLSSYVYGRAIVVSY